MVARTARSAVSSLKDHPRNATAVDAVRHGRSLDCFGEQRHQHWDGKTADPQQPASTWQTLRQALNDGFQSIDRRLQEYGPLEPEHFSLQEANQRLAKRLERMRFRA